MFARAKEPRRAAARVLGDAYSETHRAAQNAWLQSRARVAELDRAIAAQSDKLYQTRAQIAAMMSGARPHRRVGEGPLGVRLFQRQASPAKVTARAAHPWAERGRAGVSGAADAASMGLADPVTSATRAIIEGGFEGWSDRYDANLKAAEAQDRYDAAHYPVARAVGQGVGTVGAVAAMSATPLGAAGAVARFAPAAGRLAPNVGHVLRLGAVGGAASGVVGQAGSDLASQRLSSGAAYLGAGVGGALGGLAAPYLGATEGGAIAGGAIPAAQAALSGHMPSLDEVSEGAAGGAIIGSVLGGLGARSSKTQSTRAKGALGERLSLANTRMRIETPVTKHERIPLAGGSKRFKYFQPDHTTNTGRYIEAKFGDFAKISTRQQQALQQGLPLEIQHWLPRDIAAFISSVVAAAGPGQISRPNRPKR